MYGSLGMRGRLAILCIFLFLSLSLFVILLVFDDSRIGIQIGEKRKPDQILDFLASELAFEKYRKSEKPIVKYRTSHLQLPLQFDRQFTYKLQVCAMFQHSSLTYSVIRNSSFNGDYFFLRSFSSSSFQSLLPFWNIVND